MCGLFGTGLFTAGMMFHRLEKNMGFLSFMLWKHSDFFFKVWFFVGFFTYCFATLPITVGLALIFSFDPSIDQAFQDLSGDKRTASTEIAFLVLMATQLI